MKSTFRSDFVQRIKEKRSELADIRSNHLTNLERSYYAPDADILRISKAYLEAHNDLMIFDRGIRDIMDFFLSWEDIASLGKNYKIAAIKKLRGSYRNATMTLTEAKDTVEAYAKEKGYW